MNSVNRRLPVGLPEFIKHRDTRDLIEKIPYPLESFVLA